MPVNFPSHFFYLSYSDLLEFLQSYVFSKNSISMMNSLGTQQKACMWSQKLAGKMLGWAKEQVKKAAPSSQPMISNDLQDSALCNPSVQVLNLALTAGTKHISHLKDN